MLFLLKNKSTYLRDTTLAFSTDGRRIVCQAGDILRLYESDTGEIIDSLPGQNVLGGVGFALSPDSRRLAVHRGKIAIYDLTAEGFSKVLVSISESLPGGGLHLSFSPDGKRLVGSGGGDSAIYDSFTGAYQLTLRGGSWASEFLADSQRVISTDGDRHVKIWDADNNRERTKLTTGYIPCAIAKDGSRLLVHIPLEGEDGEDIGSARRPGLDASAAGRRILQTEFP
jgi:WD40 repeat protein